MSASALMIGACILCTSCISCPSCMCFLYPLWRALLGNLFNVHCDCLSSSSPWCSRFHERKSPAILTSWYTHLPHLPFRADRNGFEKDFGNCMTLRREKHAVSIVGRLPGYVWRCLPWTVVLSILFLADTTPSSPAVLPPVLLWKLAQLKTHAFLSLRSVTDKTFRHAWMPKAMLSEPQGMTRWFSGCWSLIKEVLKNENDVLNLWLSSVIEVNEDWCSQAPISQKSIIPWPVWLKSSEAIQYLYVRNRLIWMSCM